MARRGVGRGTSRRTPRRSQRGWVTSRGDGEESRSRTWWGSDTGVYMWAHGGGSGQRASRGVAGVCGPRDTGAGRAQRHAGVGGDRSSPWTDLDNPSWAGIGGGGGCGRHPVRGPGRTPLLVVVAGRAGTPRHATRGLCGGRGVPRLEGARPLSCGQHTPGGTPKIYRSGPARE